MTDCWSLSPAYTWTCKCGVRLIASDSVELERLRRQHFDFHMEGVEAR